MKRRGRPPISGRAADLDVVMGGTVETLLSGGYSLRGPRGAAAAVAKAAAAYGRTDDGSSRVSRALSSERIEQIHERWRSEAFAGLADDRGLLRSGNFSVSYLKSRHPWRPSFKRLDAGGRLEAVTEILFANDGLWPAGDSRHPRRFPGLTRGAAAAWSPPASPSARPSVVLSDLWLIAMGEVLIEAIEDKRLSKTAADALIAAFADSIQKIDFEMEAARRKTG